MMTVLSFISLFKLSCIFFSLSTSRLADISSRIRIGASLRNALAIDNLCLSPPESSAPFSPTLVLKPSGSFSIKSIQLARAAASFTSSSVALSLPSLIFSSMLVLKRVTSWNTMDIFLNKESVDIFLMSFPSISMLPPS